MDSEAARVQIEEIERLKSRKRLTLLFDGWEDKLRRSLYGIVAAEVGQYPVVISLSEMTGIRGTADNYLETMKKGLREMEIGDARNVIALTTDDPTVMQSFRRKFQGEFHWTLVTKNKIPGQNNFGTNLNYLSDPRMLLAWAQYNNWEDLCISIHETNYLKVCSHCQLLQ